MADATGPNTQRKLTKVNKERKDKFIIMVDGSTMHDV